MKLQNKKLCFPLLFLLLGIPFFCKAADDITNSDYFKIDKGCGITMGDNSSGSITCKPWEKGSQVTYNGASVGTCVCDYNCLPTPSSHYYYDDPVAKTRQTDDKNITLPVVLAWDNIEAWLNEKGEYVLYSSEIGQGWKDSVTSKAFGARSYALEIDNTNGEINDSASLGGIFSRVLTTPEFNPTKLFYPCFFKSGRTIKWRVRPCCKEDGSFCLPKDKAPWWEFTTSYAPEPIIASDPDWNGSDGAAGISFKGFQINWCKVSLLPSQQYAKSYRLMVSSDEKGTGTLNCHPLMVSGGQCRDDDILADSQTGEVIPSFPIQSRQDHALFTRNRTYVWKMKTCFDETASRCSDYGQSWKLSTKTSSIGVPSTIFPKNDPQGINPVGLPVSISWTIPDGANSFTYQASFISGDKNTIWSVAPSNESSSNDRNSFDAENLKPDTQYKWRVKACSQFNSQNCDGWSEWFVFRTTGRPPKADSLAATADAPILFSWEAVGGAKSYNFSLAKKNGAAKITVLNNSELLVSPKYSLGYPDIDQGQSYSWKVQTCAHSDGKVCGAWSQEKNFDTKKLSAAVNPKPGNDSIIYADQPAQNISWDQVPGASAYRLTVALKTSNEKQACSQNKIEKITSRNAETVELKCLGVYQMAVQPCVDSDCRSAGPTSEWKFTLGQHAPTTKSGFAVCGASYDYPDTPWNEREACQPKHLLVLVKVFLDFLLFKLSIFLLPIMVLATGLIFYSQYKTPETWDKVRLAWKAVGIGYAILALSWIIVGIILQIAGYSGLWFKIL